MARYIAAMKIVLCHRIQELDSAILASKDSRQVRRFYRLRRRLVRRWRFVVGAQPPLM